MFQMIGLFKFSVIGAIVFTTCAMQSPRVATANEATVRGGICWASVSFEEGVCSAGCSGSSSYLLGTPTGSGNIRAVDVGNTPPTCGYTLEGPCEDDQTVVYCTF